MMKALAQFDVIQWVENHPEAQVFRSPSVAGPAQKAKHPNRTADAYVQARAWLSHVKPAIQGQNGSSHTFGVAYGLLKGFDLSESEALSLLKEWNVSCQPPWDDSELEAKISSAERRPSNQPNGYKLKNISQSFAGLFQAVEPKSLEAQDREHSGILDDPASIAVRFMVAYKTDHNLCMFRWWHDQFYLWNGSFYDPVPDKEMNSLMFWFIEDAYIKKYFEDCSNRPLEQVDKVSKRKVGKSVIENVKMALINIIKIDDKSGSEPFWLVNAPYGWQADQVIPASNRLVHLPSFATNLPKSFIPKTPKYFSTYSLNYSFDFDKYDGPAQAPPAWDYVLNSIWQNDLDSILALQEWFGYLLTPNTRLQKLLLLIGTRRSGKGTILRVLNHMLGSQNITYPTFKLITSDFGKQSLIGKSLAIFPDARITSKTDVGDMVELLLSITGEDSQTINRKYLETTTRKLFCRFLISSNMLPSLSENSGALVSRAIILKFSKSFLGQEDTELENKLIPEIPDILRWSIDGWCRLNQRKAFLQPDSGLQLVKQFLNLSSPISNYIHDCLDEGASYTDDLLKMFSNYRMWAKTHNRDYVGDLSTFQRNLQSVIPSISFSDHNTVYNGDSMAWSKIVTGAKIKPTENGHGAYDDNSIRSKEFDELYKASSGAGTA